MAPPLVKGKALAQRRIAGIVFVVVIALLIEMSVAIYQKKFTPTVDVSLKAGRIGNQLTKHADVKVRGLIVGEVRSVRSEGDGATLALALDPDKVGLIPKNVQAQLLPKTLFGEKQVALVIPADASADHLSDGDVISQDRSSTALETEEALNNLLPVLRSLEPQKLSLTLNALATALRGRGDQLGDNLVTVAAYFRRINPELPTLGEDMAELAKVAQNYTETTPDLMRTLDNLSFSSRSLVEERQRIDTFLRTTGEFSATAQAVVGENEQHFVDLARESKPVLNLFAQYSGNYACLLNRIAFSEIEAERVEGGLQPGLHITLEMTQDQGGYAAGDETKYKERRTFGCYGLGSKPIKPMPSHFNPQDGYHDSDPPETPNSGPGGSGEPPPSGGAWQGSVASPSSAQRSTPMPQGSTMMDALLLGGLS